MGGANIQENSPHSVTPKPYPVSARAYKKKDYDYLSKFNRTSVQGPWKNRRDQEIPRHSSNFDSDYSTFTRSSADSGSSNSFESSSSTSSFEKLCIDLENHHPFLGDESILGSLRMTEVKFKNLAKETEAQSFKSMYKAISENVEDQPENHDTKANSENVEDQPENHDTKANSENVEDQPENHDTNESAGPSGRVRNGTFDIKIKKPRALPKFGEWDGQDRSSEESYTVIFEKIRDHKRSGGLFSHAESSEEGMSRDGNVTGCLSNEEGQSKSKEAQVESSLTEISTEGSCDEKSLPESKCLSKPQGVRQKRSSLVSRLWLIR